MTVPPTPPRPPVRPAVAVAFCVVGFFALVVAGLGLLSLATDTDVIDVPGLGQLPGIVGMLAALAAFAGTTWATVRRPQPAYGGVVVAVVGTWLAYVLVTGIAAAAAAGELGPGIAVTGSFALGWQGLVIAGAALVAGWSAIALVRTRASRPQWPWERDDQDE
ncbi:hypothetical protein [Microbacterium sp. GXF7504]